VATLVKKAYAAGASKVQVTWFDPAIARLTMQHAAIEQLAKYPSWRADSFMQLVEQDAAFIVIHAPDSHLYRDIDPERVTTASRAEWEANHLFLHALHGTFSVNWTVGAVATRAWAGLLFPHLPLVESIELTWGIICRSTRADADDPVAAWQEHLDQLTRRESYLNQAGIRKLHYRAPGTDLEIELIPGSKWMSCANIRSKRGVPFVLNIPSGPDAHDLLQQPVRRERLLPPGSWQWLCRDDRGRNGDDGGGPAGARRKPKHNPCRFHDRVG
jgi:aminopeptidase